MVVEAGEGRAVVRVAQDWGGVDVAEGCGDRTGRAGPVTVRLENLQRAFGAETALPLSVWTYSTVDPLKEVLAKGYFRGCLRELRLGDLILCATDEPADWKGITGKCRRRRVLLMVTSTDWRGIETRVVQDWGSPAAPARRRQPAPWADLLPTVTLPARRRQDGLARRQVVRVARRPRRTA